MYCRHQQQQQQQKQQQQQQKQQKQQKQQQQQQQRQPGASTCKRSVWTCLETVGGPSLTYHHIPLTHICVGEQQHPLVIIVITIINTDIRGRSNPTTAPPSPLPLIASLQRRS